MLVSMVGGKEILQPEEKELFCWNVLFLEQFEATVLKIKSLVSRNTASKTHVTFSVGSSKNA